MRTRIQRLLAAVLTVCMIVTYFPLAALAEEAPWYEYAKVGNWHGMESIEVHRIWRGKANVKIYVEDVLVAEATANAHTKEASYIIYDGQNGLVAPVVRNNASMGYTVTRQHEGSFGLTVIPETGEFAIASEEETLDLQDESSEAVLTISTQITAMDRIAIIPAHSIAGSVQVVPDIAMQIIVICTPAGICAAKAAVMRRSMEDRG